MTLTLRPADVFKEYGICQKTLANMRNQRRGPAYSALSARMVLYKRADIERWLAANRVTPEGSGSEE